MSWYDNEWGYANQLLREALSVTSVGKHDDRDDREQAWSALCLSNH